MQSKNWNIKDILFVIVTLKKAHLKIEVKNVCFFLLLSKDWNIKDISSVIWILEEASEKQVKISQFALIYQNFI